MTYLFSAKEIRNSFVTGNKAEGLARVLIDIIALFGMIGAFIVQVKDVTIFVAAWTMIVLCSSFFIVKEGVGGIPYHIRDYIRRRKEVHHGTGS